MENEVMNNVELDDVIEVFQDDEGMNGNVAIGMVLGAALTGVGIAMFKWIKNKWTEHQIRKTKGVLKFDDMKDKDEDEDVTVE